MAIPPGADGLSYGNPGLFLIQLLVTVETAAFKGLATFLPVALLDRTMGIRSNEQDQDEGLDPVEHGEKGYHELGCTYCLNTI